MLNYTTATGFSTGKDRIINFNHIIKVDVHASGRTEFTDINGNTFLVEEPIENITVTTPTIRLIQATQLYQKGQNS